MYTVFDYIKYYKDISLKKTKWNAIDNLICTLLCYLPIREINDEKIHLNELHTKLLRTSSDYDNPFIKKVIQIFEMVENSIRYKDMYILKANYKKNKSVQFGAVTFKIGNIKVIAFKGTDSSHIGWLENFRLIYEYPTNTHILAINYLDESISPFDNNVYVVGHSKGGNLAMVSAMELSNFKFSKIKKVYNFDGPGFRKSEFDSEKYDRLSKKLVNILPSGSMVGVLMYNKDYNVIKSNTVAGLDHFPISWNIFGEFFVEDDLLSLGRKLHDRTTKELDKIDPLLFKEFIEELFDKLTKEKTNDIKFSFKAMKKVYDGMKDVDPQIKKYIDDIFYFMIMPTGRVEITKKIKKAIEQ